MITFPRFVLLSLAFFGDVWTSLPKTEAQAVDFWFGERVRFHKRKSLVNSLQRLLKTEKISKVIEKGKVKIQITPEGLRFLGIMKLDLGKFSDRSWDEKWRIVVFDIQEKSKKDRDILRNKLKELGFGMLQESVWISPFPLEKELRDYFDNYKIGGEILATISKVLVGDQKELANRIWKLEKLNGEYADLCEEWEYRKAIDNFKEAYDFERNFFELLFKDPFLPQDLLPRPWYGGSAKKIYTKEVKNILNRG